RTGGKNGRQNQETGSRDGNRKSSHSNLLLQLGMGFYHQKGQTSAAKRRVARTLLRHARAVLAAG
ncbi:MAG TPA: hypothetical protein VEK12_07420, partial [Alphaproteobacteria bacterium]|nr:hypothetical protein [Alphaproteobacteria bacterium]